jgi:hypothetical protein
MKLNKSKNMHIVILMLVGLLLTTVAAHAQEAAHLESEYTTFIPVVFSTAPHNAPVPQGTDNPSSEVIQGVTFDWSTYKQQAPGSDNWPITWADDGHQYTSFGDGGGFGGTNQDGRVSLGVARIEGDSANYQGINLWGGKNARNSAQFEGKSYGIISIDGVLYMWVSPGSNASNYKEARLAVSHDHSESWAKLDWAFTQSEKIILPTFLQFGQDYAGARDEYVYSYSIRLQNASDLIIQKPGIIDLMRAPRNRLTERTAYEFFKGLDRDGNPQWTKDLNERQPVFEDPAGVGWNVSVTYNPGLKRYLLMTEHEQTMRGNLGIFDAAEPWGPWTTVHYENGFGKDHIRASSFYWVFSNKWFSNDGKNFVMIFTGTNTNDAINIVRGQFILKK